MSAQPTLTPVGSSRGAPMGRSEWRGEPVGPLRLFRVRMVDGDYDVGGAYWGGGPGVLPLYCATDGEAVRLFIRAADRWEAWCEVRERCPGARLRQVEPAPVRYWWTDGSGRIELQMTLAQARGAGHGGRCDDDVAALATAPAREGEPDIPAQMVALAPKDVRAALREYGTWDAEELADHAANLQRLLWIACSDVAERPEDHR